MRGPQVKRGHGRCIFLVRYHLATMALKRPSPLATAGLAFALGTVYAGAVYRDPQAPDIELPPASAVTMVVSSSGAPAVHDWIAIDPILEIDRRVDLEQLPSSIVKST